MAEEGNPSSQRDHSVACGSFQQTTAGQTCLHLPLWPTQNPTEHKPSLHPGEMTQRTALSLVKRRTRSLKRIPKLLGVLKFWGLFGVFFGVVFKLQCFETKMLGWDS